MMKINKPPYKSVNGMWYTEAIFFDRMSNKPQSVWIIEPVFTFFDTKKGYINGQETFLELGDPTGYAWALKYLGDYNHWVRLMKTSWFPEVVAVWKEHLATKLRSDALWKVREIASGDSTQALAAAKYLAEEGWIKSTKGRPSQEAINKELKQLTKAAQAEDDDAVRIGLKVVNGGNRS